MRKRRMGRLTALLLAVVMTAAMMPGGIQVNADEGVTAADYGLCEPVCVEDDNMYSGYNATWDCVWFGTYPKTEIVASTVQCGLYGADYADESVCEVDKDLYEMLEAAQYDENNDTVIDGVKYRRLSLSDCPLHQQNNRPIIATAHEYRGNQSYFYWESDIEYHYFRYDPIKWRVLDVEEDGTALLFADGILDNRSPGYKNGVNARCVNLLTGEEEEWWHTFLPYNKSSIRYWLNGLEISDEEVETLEQYMEENPYHHSTWNNNYEVELTADKMPFFQSAFTFEEQNAVLSTERDNAIEINIYNTAKDERITDLSSLKDSFVTYDDRRSEDRVFLLSFEELMNPEYGFATKKLPYMLETSKACWSADFNENNLASSEPSAYASAMGADYAYFPEGSLWTLEDFKRGYTNGKPDRTYYCVNGYSGYMTSTASSRDASSYEGLMYLDAHPRSILYMDSGEESPIGVHAKMIVRCAGLFEYLGDRYDEGINFCEVRPALRMDLNSGLWSYAGTVSSDGTVNEVNGPEPVPQNTQAPPDVTLNDPVTQDETPLINYVIPTAAYNNAVMTDVIKSTWDCVWFGSYPQTEIVDSQENSYLDDAQCGDVVPVEVDADLFARLEEAPYDRFGDTVVDGVKYRRVDLTTLDEWAKGSYDDGQIYNYWAFSPISSYGYVSDPVDPDDEIIHTTVLGYFTDLVLGHSRSSMNDQLVRYHYYRYDPVKWRVLDAGDGSALLLADKVLDSRIAEAASQGESWESDYYYDLASKDAPGNYKDAVLNSEHMGRLNGISRKFCGTFRWVGDCNQNSYEPFAEWGTGTLSFLEAAFSASDREALIADEDGYLVQLPTKYDICNPDYGFDTHTEVNNNRMYIASQTRSAQGTAFAASGGAFLHDTLDRIGAGAGKAITEKGTMGYSLKQTELDEYRGASSVSLYIAQPDGSIKDGVEKSQLVTYRYTYAYRPMIRLDTTKGGWSYAGTVCSDGTAEEPGAATPAQSLKSKETASAFEPLSEPLSGSIGSDADAANSTTYWTIDTEGTLTISGAFAQQNVNEGSWWEKYSKNIKKARFELTDGAKVGVNPSNVVTAIAHMPTDYLFAGLDCLESVDLTNLDIGGYTENTANNYRTVLMEGWFRGCRSLKEIKGLDGLDTSLIMSTDRMFEGCTSLRTLDLSAWDTPHLCNMDSMFKDCVSLEQLDLSGSFNTGNAIALGHMFDGCESLRTIKLGNGVTKLGQLPTFSVFGQENWYAASDGSEYTSGEIRSELLGIAETYSKIGPNVEVPFEVTSEEDWNFIARYFADGNSLANSTLELTNDIEVTHPIGNGTYPFDGTFNGNGHTLTFNKTATDQNCAPFAVTNNAAFRDLHIDGTIETNHKFAGGLIGTANGSNTVTNCRSSIVILSGIDGDGTHGGFVGRNNVAYEGCVFDGKIIGEKTTSCGAFQGWNSADSTCFNCISDASEIRIHTTGGTFIRNGSLANLTNCYYMQPIGQGRDHGKQAYSVKAANGVSIGFGEGIYYDVSGITAYSTGIVYKGVFYAGPDDQLNLTMADPSAQDKKYIASAGILSGTGTAYTLLMPESDVIISLVDSAVADLLGDMEDLGDITNDIGQIKAQLEAGGLSEDRLTELTGRLAELEEETEGLRSAFDTLTDAQKALFSEEDLKALAAAEQQLGEAITEADSIGKTAGEIAAMQAENKAAADKVIEMISVLPDPDTFDPSDRAAFKAAMEKFNAAEDAYAALTPQQKALVTNIDVLIEKAQAARYAMAGVEPASIALNKEKANIEVKKTLTLKATVKPDGAEVVWTSSDPKVAKVDKNGKVTAVKQGKAVITAAVKDTDASASCAVRVLFSDVPGDHNFFNAVYWAADTGITGGYTGAKAGLFGPGDPVQRGQVVMFLWRMAGQPKPKDMTTQKFKDVPKSNNFFTAIQWASEKGIAGGYTGAKAGLFGPNDNCTRGQIAMFIWRYYGKKKPAPGGKTFKDVPKSNNFYTAVMWASGKKITAGYSDGTFGVNKDCTRGQMVTFLYRGEGSPALD